MLSSHDAYTIYQYVYAAHKSASPECLKLVRLGKLAPLAPATGRQLRFEGLEAPFEHPD